ncbi:MAG: ShlB/FhaC/HecB family hemolysin secretion/activation protein [Parasphingorhabdus sp.]|uniref:ShlB/FhaC/HecB family hemolysin secretion/activation protein n=1 Tax=Parasphingorhabdus sp. TaxID=2709688 RepID=UPI0030010268
MKIVRLAGAVNVLTILSATNVYAQQITPPTRDEIDPAVPSIEKDRTRLTIEDSVERSPCPLDKPEYDEIRVDIDDVFFNNLKGITEAEIRQSYEPYLGKSQPIKRVCEIRDAAATLLRNKGYLAAVEVPAQRIEDGHVKFEVLYARITNIRVRGQAGRAEKLIGSYLAKLENDEIFDRNNAERYLLLARDLPGYDVRLSLRPAGTGPGELIGDVTVTRTPFDVDFNIQNLAAKDTGIWGGQIRAQFHGLTGMGDSTSISFYSTSEFREQQILQAGHSFRVGSEGLRFDGRFTYAWTKPDLGDFGGGNTPDLTARTLLASIEASYPLIRSQTRNITAAGGFDYVNQKVDFITPLSEDRLRVAYARITADAVDSPKKGAPRWRMTGSLELRRGLNLLGASKGCNPLCPAGVTLPSRSDGDPTATTIRASVSAEYVVSPELSFFIKPKAQYAFDPLFSFEEYSAGNYTIGRGYEPGVIIGDDGVGFQFEARGPRISPPKMSNVSIQPFGFVDAAWVWNKDRPGNLDPQRLLSVGGGLRSSFSDRARLDLTVAVPTRAAGLQTRKGDVRFLISFTTKLLPWGKR